MNLYKLIENVKYQFKSDISWISLILVNIITLTLAIIQKWNVGTIFYIYLWQTIFLWFFVLLKLLFKKNISFIGAVDNTGQLIPIESESLSKFQVIISQFSWILFFGVYFLFIYLLFNPPIFNFWINITIISFFINHLISFIYYLKKNEEKEELAKNLIKITGYRIIVIHMTIWLTGLFLYSSSNTKFSFNLMALIVLFIFKTPVDIYFHNKEHETMQEIQEEKNRIINKIEENEKIIKSIKEDNQLISPEENKRNLTIIIIFIASFFILPLFFGKIGVLIWLIMFAFVAFWIINRKSKKLEINKK